MEDLEARVADLERLVKHQGEQLAIHAKNMEQHAGTLANVAKTVTTTVSGVEQAVREVSNTMVEHAKAIEELKAPAAEATPAAAPTAQ